MIKLMSIAGARPNFMKLASIVRAVEKHNQQITTLASISHQPITHIIVHTGQHYDSKMSESFFTDLGLPKPDINLEVGSGSHAVQTAEIMKRFEPVLQEQRPDVLLVVGDVNSTIACTLVASKIEYPATAHKLSTISHDLYPISREPGVSRKRPLIVHVEAGLRSFDRDMPEEINRILTDAISDLLFITEESGIEHLQHEGISKEKIHFVGNVMIDTLMQHLDKADRSIIRQQLNLPSSYILVTLHRPSNVDHQDTLASLVDCLQRIAAQRHIVFPVHPRTRNNLNRFGLWKRLEEDQGITLTEPLGYLDFLNLVKNASIVVTDSGGIQEETTFLKIPCVTLRENTERPVTVSIGTNYLIGKDPLRIMETVTDILNGQGKKGEIPRFWDGKAGDRIVKVLAEAVSE